MGAIEDFNKINSELTLKMSGDETLKKLSKDWLYFASKYEYSYHFTWMGRPIIQFPQDVMAIQEIIWKTQPDLIIETGIAHGGSLIFHASLLELIGKDGQVLGIDIDIREHNRKEIEKHSMFKRISMIEGSSTDDQIVQKVYDFSKDKKNILVILDSNHTHEHVLKEMELYSPLVKKNSYLLVLDGIIEDMPQDFVENRPWGIGNNPKTAILEFLKNNKRFEIDSIEDKLLISGVSSGYLRCISD